jgi:hypothetical protein
MTRLRVKLVFNPAPGNLDYIEAIIVGGNAAAVRAWLLYEIINRVIDGFADAVIVQRT